MDSSSDSDVSIQKMSKKRLYEDEDMGFNRKKKKKKKEKDRNLSRHVMCKGATVNSAGCLCALARAKKVEANLSPEFPSCVKFLTQLQVPGGREQYLVLPKKFCSEHLPIDKDTVVFVDENEKEFRVGYRSNNCRFRIGWKSFSNANRLLKGDVLVFHLIEHCKFKVYIVRSCRPTKVHGAIQNPKKDVLTVTENGDDQMAGNARTGIVKEELLDHSPQHSYQERITPATEQRDGSGGSQFPASVVKFQGVKGFEDFNISLDGLLIIDSELSTDVRVKYYELCNSQKMFLHEHLITGLGSKLVSGVISETSKIADAIESASVTHSIHNLESLERTLKAFEALGMNVEFLRTRVDKLLKISRQYQATNQPKVAKLGQVEAKKKALGESVSTMEALQKSMAALQESIKILEAEIDDIEGKNEELGLEFKEIATASW